MGYIIIESDYLVIDNFTPYFFFSHSLSRHPPQTCDLPKFSILNKGVKILLSRFPSQFYIISLDLPLHKDYTAPLPLPSQFHFVYFHSLRGNFLLCKCLSCLFLLQHIERKALSLSFFFSCNRCEQIKVYGADLS